MNGSSVGGPAASTAPIPMIRGYISKEASIVRGSSGHPVEFGEGCVIHPYAVIDASKGPIRFGDYCIVEDGAVIVNEVSSKCEDRTMIIGKGNRFGPRCNVQSCRIGDGNEFRAQSSTGIMSVIEDGCCLVARARVTHDAHLVSKTQVMSNGVWFSRQPLSVEDVIDMHVKITRRFIR